MSYLLNEDKNASSGTPVSPAPGWTDSEYEEFLRAVSRYTRADPIQISRDMGGKKNPVQIARLLARMEEELLLVEHVQHVHVPQRKAKVTTDEELEAEIAKADRKLEFERSKNERRMLKQDKPKLKLFNREGMDFVAMAPLISEAAFLRMKVPKPVEDNALKLQEKDVREALMRRDDATAPRLNRRLQRRLRVVYNATRRRILDDPHPAEPSTATAADAVVQPSEGASSSASASVATDQAPPPQQEESQPRRRAVIAIQSSESESET